MHVYIHHIQTNDKFIFSQHLRELPTSTMYNHVIAETNNFFEFNLWNIQACAEYYPDNICIKILKYLIIDN